jgi:hypothetical protein
MKTRAGPAATVPARIRSRREPSTKCHSRRRSEQALGASSEFADHGAVGAEGAVDAAALRPADVRRAGRRSRSSCDRGKSRRRFPASQSCGHRLGIARPRSGRHTPWRPDLGHAGQLARRLGRRSCWSAGDRGRPSLRRLDSRRGCLLRSQDGARAVAAALSNRCLRKRRGRAPARLLRGGRGCGRPRRRGLRSGRLPRQAHRPNDLGERAAADEHERRLLLGAACRRARRRSRRLGLGCRAANGAGPAQCLFAKRRLPRLEHTDGPRRGQRRRHHRST